MENLREQKDQEGLLEEERPFYSMVVRLAEDGKVTVESTLVNVEIDKEDYVSMDSSSLAKRLTELAGKEISDSFAEQVLEEIEFIYDAVGELI